MKSHICKFSYVTQFRTNGCFTITELPRSSLQCFSKLRFALQNRAKYRERGRRERDKIGRSIESEGEGREKELSESEV